VLSYEDAGYKASNLVKVLPYLTQTIHNAYPLADGVLVERETGGRLGAYRSPLG